MTVQSGSDANGNGDTAGDRAVFNPSGTPGTGSGVTPLCTSSLPGFATCGENDFDPTVGPPGPGNFNSTPFIVAYGAINPNAQYIQAGKFAQLNAGRNTIASRHINDLDLTAMKRVSFTENYRVEISLQALNVLNHPQFVPGYLNDVTSISFTGSRAFLNPGSSAFGDIEGTFPSNARSLQIGLKFIF
jgi:hypothetical protein